MAPTDDQQDLIQTIHDALLPDPDILAAWLSGSLGAGSGDAFSDVDVLLLAPTGEAGTVARRYAEDLSPIAETLIVNRLGNGRVVSAVTTDWRRFDLTFIEEAELAFYDRARLSPLFNKTEAEPPIAERRPYQTEPTRPQPSCYGVFPCTRPECCGAWPGRISGRAPGRRTSQSDDNRPHA